MRNFFNELFRNKIKALCTVDYRDTILRFHLNSTDGLINVNVTKLGKGSGHTYGKVIASQNVRSFRHLDSKAVALETFGVRSRRNDQLFATFSDSGSLMHETVAATPDDEVYAFGFVCQEFDVVIPERTLCSQSEQLFVPLRLPTTWRYSRKFSERRTTSYVTTDTRR